METNMTTAEAGGMFAPAVPSRAEIKAAKLEKARAVLSRPRSGMVQERALIVCCPRHNGDSTMTVTVTYGVDQAWAPRDKPFGCSVELHTFTPDERAVLNDRIDVAFGNWTTNQEERGAE